jgi:thiol:disulfide interchange protein
MTPIVNGLEQEFSGKVAFQYLNAADGAQGQRTFEQLRLPGHPSYVLFAADGRELYRSFGLVDAERLRNAISASLTP